MKNVRRLTGWTAAIALGLTIALVSESQAQQRSHGRRGAPDVSIYMDAHRFTPGQQIGFTVTVDRPAYVAVFRVNRSGKLSRVTRNRRGVYVTPWNPFRMNDYSRRNSLVAGRKGKFELIAIASRRPLRASNTPVLNCALNSHTGHWTETGFDSHYGFDAMFASMGRRGRLSQDRASYVVKRGRGNVRVAPWITMPRFRAELDFEIGSRARVYINGAFTGLGMGGLVVSSPGWHKVTVHKPNGRKFTRRVRFVADAVKSDRTRYWGERPAETGRYNKKKR